MGGIARRTDGHREVRFFVCAVMLCLMIAIIEWFARQPRGLLLVGQVGQLPSEGSPNGLVSAKKMCPVATGM